MPKNRARKRELMEFDILKSLSGDTPEEIAASGIFTEEEAKVISGAKIAVKQALELLKQKGVEKEALDISKDILVGNVSVTTDTKEIPFGVVTTKLPFGTVYVGPTKFDGEPGIMEEVVIKNITTGEETVVSQVVVKAPVPAQQIVMEDEPNRINSIGVKPQIDSTGNEPPFIYHPQFPHISGTQFAGHPHQGHLRPKGKPDNTQQSENSEHNVLEDFLSSLGIDGRNVRVVPMHEGLPGRPPQFTPEQLKSMSVARELDEQNSQTQDFSDFEALKGLLGL